MPDVQMLSQELDSALREQQISAVYQPQIDAATNAVVAVEGLCRWTRSDGTAVGPDVFIPLAEESGAIYEIGRFMLDDCLVQIEHWRGRNHLVDVSVNVSPLQLTTDRFADYLLDRLAEHDLFGDPLTIEITESLPVSHIAQIVPRLQRLRAAGVGVSLDDYGVGHAALPQLELLPLSEVKLDRSLIQSEDAAAIRTLREAVGRAHDLGLRVVAEGVETAAHRDFACSLGCDRLQGYLFAPPLRVEALDDLLDA